MGYINKDDMLMVDGRVAVATSSDYTRLVYDAQDWESMRSSRDYEGGTAVGYVDVLYTDTGERSSIPTTRARLVSQR